MVLKKFTKLGLKQANKLISDACFNKIIQAKTQLKRKHHQNNQRIKQQYFTIYVRH